MLPLWKWNFSMWPPSKFLTKYWIESVPPNFWSSTLNLSVGSFNLVSCTDEYIKLISVYYKRWAMFLLIIKPFWVSIFSQPGSFIWLLAVLVRLCWDLGFCFFSFIFLALPCLSKINFLDLLSRSYIKTPPPPPASQVLLLMVYGITFLSASSYSSSAAPLLSDRREHYK